LLERANLFWKVLEQIFGSNNDKRSSSNILEKTPSSSILFDQDQEEQSSVQKEELRSTGLGKPDGPVSQKRYEDLLYSHKELMDSYALLESAHEVMISKVKDFL
jgi:hypothetical protein